VEQPEWVLSEVLLSPDLVPHILAQLPIKEHAAKGTCRAWCRGWKETLVRRERPRLLVIGGYNSNDGERLNSLERYDPSTNEWKGESLAPMPSARPDVGMAVLDGKLYAVGGYGDGDPGDPGSVERYDFETKAWEAVASMATERVVPAVAVLDGKLYAVGDFNDDRGDVNLVERYDPALDAWEAVAPMETALACCGVAALDGKLYAVGGIDDDGGSSSLERYDPATNAWEEMAPMATARIGCGVAVLDGKLYAAGGFHDEGGGYLNSVERYDPAANAWEEVAPMGTARQIPLVAVLDGKLYAVGGKDYDVDDGLLLLSSVERYDPTENAWEAVAPISTVRTGAGIALL